jgi:DeoR/GlpR family transcriptional regulator of sugar metabolism
MRGQERRKLIEEFLAGEGEVSVDGLARRLGTTPSTIRRDLTRLTAEGKVTRTYGGAVIAAIHSPEPTLHQRSGLLRAEKNAIGHWAAAQVGPGETVILDAGTTTARVAYHLRDQAGLTVVTNGLTSISELADADDIEVVSLGGSLRHISQSFVGPLTDMALARITADRAFLGADGLVAERGICEASTVQTHAKEIMAAQSGRVYVLADHGKIGHAPFNAWALLPGPWTLVTDDATTPEQLAPFHAQPHIEVVVVPVLRSRDLTGSQVPGRADATA